MNPFPHAVVIGGAGFLGSHLVERFMTEGYVVTCVDDLSTGSLVNVPPGAHFLRHDITRRLELRERVDLVLHFASAASPVHYARLSVETLLTGSLGTLHALELARSHEARFIFASTSEVYGDPEVHPQPETYWGRVNPIGPRSMYDEAKRFGEALVTAYRTRYGLRTGIVRIFNTYGPRMQFDDGRAIPAFVSSALRGEPIRVTGDGSQTRSLCYVDDLVDGVHRMAGTDVAGPVNLGNPEELRVLDIARLVRSMTGSAVPIVHGPADADDPRRRRPDISLAAAELGWVPQVDVRTGLTSTIGWFADRMRSDGLSRSRALTGIGDS